MATKGINTYKLAQIENILKIYINFKNGEGCLCNKYDNMIDQHHRKPFYHFQHLKHIVLPEVPKKISKPQELIYSNTAVKETEM